MGELAVQDLRTKWLEDRRRGIGASESAGILNQSPWNSPLSIWADKTGAVDGDFEENHLMRSGKAFEAAIGQMFSEDTGLEVIPHDQNITHEHPDFARNHLMCTPDFLTVVGDPVEVKFSVYGDWSDGPPIHYVIQLQHQMTVLGAEKGYLVAWTPGGLYVYEEARNADFVAALEDASAKFWSQYVETKTPPPADAHPATIRTLERLHPEDNGETIVLPAEALMWSEQIEQLATEIRVATKAKKDFENKIKAEICENTFGEIPGMDKRWKWAHQDRKGFTVEPKTIRVLRKVK